MFMAEEVIDRVHDVCAAVGLSERSDRKRLSQPRAIDLPANEHDRDADRFQIPCQRHSVISVREFDVDQGHVRSGLARVAEGEERAELWRKVNEMYGGFDEYSARTTREIRLFVLEPR